MVFFISTDNIKNIFEKNPGSVTFAHLAAKLIEEGDYQKAIEKYEQAQFIDDSNIEPILKKGFTYLLMGNENIFLSIWKEDLA